MSNVPDRLSFLKELGYVLINANICFDESTGEIVKRAVWLNKDAYNLFMHNPQYVFMVPFELSVVDHIPSKALLFRKCNYRKPFAYIDKYCIIESSDNDSYGAYFDLSASIKKSISK